MGQYDQTTITLVAAYSRTHETESVRVNTTAENVVVGKSTTNALTSAYAMEVTIAEMEPY